MASSIYIAPSTTARCGTLRISVSKFSAPLPPASGAAHGAAHAAGRLAAVRGLPLLCGCGCLFLLSFGGRGCGDRGFFLGGPSVDLLSHWLITGFTQNMIALWGTSVKCHPDIFCSLPNSGCQNQDGILGLRWKCCGSSTSVNVHGEAMFETCHSSFLEDPWRLWIEYWFLS